MDRSPTNRRHSGRNRQTAPSRVNLLGAGHGPTALALASPNAGNPEKSPIPNSALFLKLQLTKLFKFAAQTVPQRAFRAKFFQQRFSLLEGLLGEFTSSK